MFPHIPHTGGVKQVQPDAGIPQHHGLLQHIAGGARNGGHNGAVKPGQQVQQGAFAHIGAAQQHTVHPAAQNRPGPVPGNQLVQRVLLLAQCGDQLCLRYLRHILLRVVNPGGQVGSQRLQSGLDARNALCQRAVQSGLCQRCPLPPFGGDDLHHGFGLGQAHAAVFQCAAGKLAGAGGRSTGQVQRFQQALGHGVAAVD